jgi:hypothetical protein
MLSRQMQRLSVLARAVLVLARTVLAGTGLSRRGLSGYVLFRYVLFRYVVGWHVLSRQRVALLRARASAHALAEPQRTGPQNAAELAGTWQVSPVPGPQREVLVVAGQVAGFRAAAGRREPVVRVRPRRSLLGIEAGGSYPPSQLGKLIAAALADGRERHRVPSQIERDLIRLPRLVPAGHGLHGQHGTINAT